MSPHPSELIKTELQPHRRVSWRLALAIGSAGLLLWLLLDATTLEHNAKASPVGTRRTVALEILRPFAGFARLTGISHVASLSNGALGRNALDETGNGDLKIPRFHYLPTPTRSTKPVRSVLIARPTVADPLRVLILGDSLGLDVGQQLEGQLSALGVVRVTLDGRVNTGLTRPDYFNWPAQAQADLAMQRPQVIVGMMGANDPQDFPGPPDIPFNSPAWRAQYAANCKQFFSLLVSTGAKVIWITEPPMQEAGLNLRVALVNQIQEAQAKAVGGISLLHASAVLGGPGGNFASYLSNGQQIIAVREPDGVHITPGGSQIVGAGVIAAMRDLLHIALP